MRAAKHLDEERDKVLTWMRKDATAVPSVQSVHVPVPSKGKNCFGIRDEGLGFRVSTE
jgi:hypothetical protein